jgi:hypothetical protein
MKHFHLNITSNLRKKTPKAAELSDRITPHVRQIQTRRIVSSLIYYKSTL